uniref:Uncharacterized protein n=1 Tax=Arundo donax TaxID=35708 RepID=A0A0A9C0I1_ARUDO
MLCAAVLAVGPHLLHAAHVFHPKKTKSIPVKTQKGPNK